MSQNIKNKIEADGFAVVNEVFSESEIDTLLKTIADIDISKPTFRKTNDLFAIRQFLKEVPETIVIIFNKTLIALINSIFGENYFVVKSIYFDKPEDSNWFVAYHQDLTISVDKKLDIDGFGPWTVKHQQFAVQPPLSILQDNFTIRIHLDDTDEGNGALKVIPQSHLKGIYRPETIDWNMEKEVTCPVQKGGIMFMKPLLLHASNRTSNHRKRRVIHIEFSRITLPANLQWSEALQAETTLN
ncbi:phytanoyl-CoA dioxygenase family protein [Emticicia agri]|uniref:Phytanoyl-CoA dioxygenase n=1 Tax=Emticicia agri TaxID=2492393 RepID=A0A4Q5M0L5_9BACT|nr:phytanoyl-CoA dioxygenase family protein [Emticicia agri]RYU95724.1 phytanoyl-CoA dioxygenase [Emticicia agri]